MTQPPSDAPLTDLPCDVQVSYGSFGPGVDTPLKQRIADMVANDPAVIEASEEGWGREGETTLCLHTQDRAAADRLFEAIVALLPVEAPRAPTTVTHRDGRVRGSGGRTSRH